MSGWLCGRSAPATHVRYAASYTVPLQSQLVQIAVRHRLHLIQTAHTTQRLRPRISLTARHRQTSRRPQRRRHRTHRIRIRIHRHRTAQLLKQSTTHRRLIGISRQALHGIRRAPERHTQQLRRRPTRTKMLRHSLRHRHHAALQQLKGTAQRRSRTRSITRNRIIRRYRAAPVKHTAGRIQQRIKRASRRRQQITNQQRIRRRRSQRLRMPMRQRRRTHRQQNHRTLLRYRQHTQRRRTHQRTTTQSIRIQRLRHQLHLTRTQRPQRRRTRTTTSRQLCRPINLTIQRKRRRLRQNITNTAEPPQIRQPQTRQLIRRRALIIPLQNLRQAIQSETHQLRIITDQQLTKRRLPRLRGTLRNLLSRQQLQRITQRITQRRRTQQAAHPARKLSRNLRRTRELNRRKTHRAIIPRVVRMRGGCIGRLCTQDVRGRMYRAASCSRSRGSAPSSAPGGASRTEPPLRMSTYAAVVWLLVLAGTVRGLDKEGFALTLAGECPLFSAWGRLEDGAPAPRECLRPK